MLPLLLLACSPGWLNTPEWSGSLHTALYITEASDEPEVAVATVLLANSYLDCDLPPATDPAELQRAVINRYAAVTREDARLVVLTLYATQTTGFAVRYALSATPGALYASLSEGSAGASYLAVNESEVEDEDGFSVLYEPADGAGDYQLELAVAEPGEVIVEKEREDQLHGEFQLDALDVSGRFRAERCPDDADLFQQSI